MRTAPALPRYDDQIPIEIHPSLNYFTTRTVGDSDIDKLGREMRIDLHPKLWTILQRSAACFATSPPVCAIGMNCKMECLKSNHSIVYVRNGVRIGDLLDIASAMKDQGDGILHETFALIWCDAGVYGNWPNEGKELSSRGTATKRPIQPPSLSECSTQ
jgi:hypothetical protein